MPRLFPTVRMRVIIQSYSVAKVAAANFAQLPELQQKNDH